MFRQLRLAGPGARLEPMELEHPCPPGFQRLGVVAATAGPRDLVAASAAHDDGLRRTPGEVVIAGSAEGARWCCAGLLPCGRCPACQAGAPLACAGARRLGRDVDGGLADVVDLPIGAGFLAPLPAGGEVGPAECVAMAALVAAGGVTYQAAAAVGMAPGDVVVLHGPPGPGALPLRLLVALGLRVTWLVPEGPDDDPGPLPADLGQQIAVARGAPEPADLPSSRIHLLDLAPSVRSVERLAGLARSSASLSLGAPVSIGPELHLERLLQGQLAIRRIGDLHPHLVLELAALAIKGRVDARSWSEAVPMEDFPAAYASLVQGHARRWPVLAPLAPLAPGAPVGAPARSR